LRDNLEIARRLAPMSSGWLDRPLLSRLRRNHALEHATIHLLSARYPWATFIGRSDVQGFYLFGDVAGPTVEQAALEALARLRAGESRLSIHPNCGTNLLTSGVLGALAAFAAFSGSSTARGRLARLPTAIFMTALALLVAQPLGTALQRSVTTQADPQGLRILEVRTWQRGRTTLHRIRTSG
jgi:hypothetical protein